jgi:hypothetical protein
VPFWGGGGSVLTQHQSRDIEKDGQCNTRNGSSGRPSALLEILYITGDQQYVIFYNIILGMGKTTNEPGSIPGDTILSSLLRWGNVALGIVCTKLMMHLLLTLGDRRNLLVLV